MQEINKLVRVKYRDDNGELKEVEGILTRRYQVSGAWHVQVEAGPTLLDLPESSVVICEYLPAAEVQDLFTEGDDLDDSCLIF